MGVSPACVAAVQDASGGTLSEGDAAELIRRMEAVRKAEEAKGNLDGLADRVRAAAAADAGRARIAAAIARKHAAETAVKFEAARAHIAALNAAGLHPLKAQLAFFEGTARNVPGARASVAATAIAYRDRYMQALNLAMVRDPATARLVQSGDPGFARAVVREMRELREGGTPGVTGNREAQALAKVYADVAEAARTDLNRHGATIGRLDGWSPQAHATERVVKVSDAEWIDFILPRLDRDRSFAGMDDAAVRLVLRDIYNEIVTGVARNPSLAEQTGRLGPANLANSLSAARVLHFKDSTAWLQYSERFGAGNIHEAMVGHLNSAAKFAAQLEMLGPNPEATVIRLRAHFARLAASDPRLTPEQRNKVARSIAAGHRVTSAWAEVSGLTSVPVNIRAAQIGSAARAWQTMAKLGGAVVSAISDLPVRVAALTYQGRSIGAAWGDAMGGFRKGSRADQERAAVLNAGFDGMRSHIVAAGIAEDMPMGALYRTQAAFFRLMGQTWWTDAMKRGTAEALSAWMATHAGTTHAALPDRYRAVLAQHGIGAAEWDAIRATVYTDDNGRAYITPDRVSEIPRATLAGLARERLEAMQAGLADRIARREAANATEAGWVQRRTDKLNADLQRALAALQRRNATADAAAGRQVARLRERIETLQLRLSELAEFQAALAEGRAWTPAAEDAAPPLWRMGEPFPEDIAAVDAEVRDLLRHPLTDPDAPERQPDQARWKAEVEAERRAGVDVRQERQAWIVIGPPAAGKSTVIDPLARRMGALVVDSDDVKTRIPEFQGGIGANAVHRESARLAAELAEDARARGDNLALPWVGKDLDGLRTEIAHLKEGGYTVHLVLAELPVEKAANRAIARFRETGRYVPLDYLVNLVGDRPIRNFEALKGEVATYARYSTDVARGEPPRFVEGTDILDSRRDGLRGDRAGGAREGEAAPGQGAGTREGGGVDAGGGGRSSNTVLSGTAPTEGGRVFSPRAERYLDEGDPATLAARAEGELRARLDSLRRAIGEVNRAAGGAERARLSEVLSDWNRRQADLDAFVARMEERAEARKGASAEELAAWDGRVARMLDDTRLGLEIKLRRFFADEMGFGVLETDAASRRLTLQGTQPGTPAGEFARFMAQFKGFPVALTQRVLGRAVLGYSPAERGLQMAHGAALIAGLVVMGYLAMTAKDFLRGYGPRDPSKAATITAALLQSGGAGIYGDFLFAQANRFGGGAVDTAVGPVAGAAGSLVDLWTKVRSGEARGGEALNVALQNTPFVSLWYARPVLDFLVLNSLREALSPGFMARQQRNRLRDYNQEPHGLLPATLF